LLLFGTALVGVVAISMAGCNRSSQESAGTVPPSTVFMSSDSSGRTMPTATLGSEGSDDDVTMKVKAALLRNENVEKFDIGVATVKGDVRLTGVVDNQTQIAEAIKVARGVEGVHGLHDDLSIKK
jgi:hyperosmotically inducible protein